MGDFDDYTTDGLRNHVALMQKEIARREAEPKSYGERAAAKLVQRHGPLHAGQVCFDRGLIRYFAAVPGDDADDLVRDIRTFVAAAIDQGRADMLEQCVRTMEEKSRRHGWHPTSLQTAVEWLRELK